MKKVRWTESEDASLVAMHCEGCSYEEIGSALGRTASAVETHAHNLRTQGVTGFASRKRRSTWTPENIAEARRLTDEGMSQSRIAHRLGTTSSYVSIMLAHVGTGTVEAAPGEPVSVSKPYLDPRVVVRELENARAALIRAERRYAEIMEPVHSAMRGAIDNIGIPWFDMGDPERDIAAELCVALHARGWVVVEAAGI